jgi:hypothetical protein
MTTSTRIRQLTAGIATLAIAGSAASAALAGGEPKNESPFTRAVVARALTEGIGVSHAGVTLAISGERKNQAPFTLRVSSASVTLAISGEAKSQLPFTRR